MKGSCREVADGFVQNARTYPSRRISTGIGQSAPRDANSHLVKRGIIIQEKMGNGSAAAADGGRVGGAGGKSDIDSASARNSLSDRIDVCGIRAGEQGRKLKVGIAGLVGVVNVSAIAPCKLERVSTL